MAEDGIPVCDDAQRRADLQAHPTLNGIDYVEVDAATHYTLSVYFLKPLPPANPANPADTADAYGITADLTAISVGGGTRVVGIGVLGATRRLTPQGDGYLEIAVDQAGDYSVYALAIATPALDRFFARIPFSFMATCPVDFDCRPPVECPPASLVEPRLDYLAKDYASFRKLLLDLLPQLNPRWTEQNPADLGIALLELLAYHGDHLSYLQDAVANEAYLETARQRISARRHARLVDYRMHDGRNAWTYLHVTANAPGVLARGTEVLTRVAAPLVGEPAPPGVVVDAGQVTVDALETDPALAASVAFETAHQASFDPRNNELAIHSWGNEECCLRPGSAEAFLYTAPAGTTAVLPALQKGDYLLLEEVLGPGTGAPADADPHHRQVVLIDSDPVPTEDPLYDDTPVQGALQRWQPGQNPLPLLRVRWRRQDALTFPLCLSIRQPDGTLLRHVSVARGNLVLVDHGLTTTDATVLGTPVPDGVPFRLPLSKGPLTMQCPAGGGTGAASGDREDLTCDVHAAQPAVAVQVTSATSATPELWSAVPDLLDSSPFNQHFVAEVDNDGRAILRFGDGEYGREITGATSLVATYRIGNGRAGNISAGALQHVALPPAVGGGWISRVRNPLAANGGVDSETIEEVRQRAPQAFRAVQLRAVTEADYAAAARTSTQIADAVAGFRWTGSWHTVFVGVNPRDPADLVHLPNGRTELSTPLRQQAAALLTRYRLAGYDLEIRAPHFAALELELEVCASPGYFRADVAEAVRQALGRTVFADGRRGFFAPGNFTFGQPVYLSRLYAAVERVEGVDSTVVTTFRRFGQADNGELARGVIAMGPWEIAQLDNDPNFMEHGVLRLNAMGGKA